MVFSTSVIILEVSNNQKERGIRESNRGRVMEDVQEPRGREAGERGEALKPARILKTQIIIGWR